LPTGRVTARRGVVRISTMSASELRAGLARLGLTQAAFGHLTGASRSTVSRSCAGPVAIQVALGWRHVEMLTALQALLHAPYQRPGWRRLREIVRQAEKPVCRVQNRKHRYRPKRKVAPPAEPWAAPATEAPTADRPSGPAPAGFYWEKRGHSWCLARMAPQYGGVI
jgi:hypothetical protein